jgi:MFS family permease
MTKKTAGSSDQVMHPSKTSAPADEAAPLLVNATDRPEAEDDGFKTTSSPYMGGIAPARFWVIFSMILFVFAAGCFDMTIMASTHPIITSHFHGANSASWLSTAFILTTTSIQPMTGRLSDAIGRKNPFLAGLLIFALGTLWCVLAQTMLQFIIARAICGLGAGVMISLGSIMVSDMVPIEIRGAYQGILNINYGVSSVLGAASGGIIAEALGWRWMFGIQVPVLLASVVVGALVVPNNLGEPDMKRKGSGLEAMKGFDTLGSLLLTVLLVFLVLGLVS